MTIRLALLQILQAAYEGFVWGDPNDCASKSECPFSNSFSEFHQLSITNDCVNLL